MSAKKEDAAVMAFGNYTLHAVYIVWGLIFRPIVH